MIKMTLKGIVLPWIYAINWGNYAHVEIHNQGPLNFVCKGSVHIINEAGEVETQAFSKFIFKYTYSFTEIYPNSGKTLSDIKHTIECQKR
jgi:hypothetical protein